MKYVQPPPPLSPQSLPQAESKQAKSTSEKMAVKFEVLLLLLVVVVAIVVFEM